MSNVPLLFERAPFLSAEGLRDPELIRKYATATGELPGGLSLQAVFSRDFTHRLVMERELLRPEVRRTDAESREASMSFLLQRIRRKPCNRLVLRAWGLDTWAYREKVDRGYVANLRRVMDGLRDKEDEPSVSMMAWDIPLMPPGYDVQLERRRDPVMDGKLKFGHRMRNRMGIHGL